ncbi:MAG: ExbD/TolR family protein [Planctomycetota bacterium]|jgi:biopolymer transport protein ExbD
MKDRRQAPDTDPPSLDMTPMIDIVFQLIIFLMLANDLSRKEIEEMVLPDVTHVQEDRDTPGRVIVNLMREGEGEDRMTVLRVKGRQVDLDGLRDFLLRHGYAAPGDPEGASTHLLLRADRGTPWRDVQWVMQAVASDPIRIRKLQFAVKDTAMVEDEALEEGETHGTASPR